MRELPDPHQYAEQYMKQLADRVGLQKAELEQAIEECKESYIREANAVRNHNIQVIVKDHRRRMNQIKREGANLRLKVCPIIALLFGLLACYNFTRADGFMMGIICSIGALAFLAMLLLGAIFDRPR